MHRIKKDALFLIDGSSILYRSYYGIRPLYTSKGIPTQAVFGFCRSIKKLIDDFDPQHAIVAWDKKGTTFRKEIFAEYKATRQAAPSDLFSQKDLIVQFAELVGLSQIAKTGYEADDLLYSIAKEHPNKEIVLVGPDKDLHQLISKNLIIFDPMKNEVIDEDVFLNKQGFEPEKLIFFHSLVGDASDNIPGVNGIGKKGATELVKQFKSLDDMYKNIDDIKSDRTKKLLIEGKDNAYLSEKLFTLRYVKTDLTLQDMKFNKDNWHKANDLFRELEFKSLVAKGGEKQISLFEEQVLDKSKKTKWNCVVIRNQDKLNELVDKLMEKKFFSIDTETTGIEPLIDKLVGISIAFDDKTGYYIPLDHTEKTQLNKEEALKKLSLVLTSKSIEKTLQNAKFDQLVLYNAGILLNGIAFDSLLAANLLRKEWDKIGLKQLSIQYLNEKMESFGDVLGKEYKSFDQVPIHEAANYSAHDALQTFKIEKVLRKELAKEKNLKKIFEDIELPLSQVLFEMEKAGVTLDLDVIKEVEKEVNRKLTSLEGKLEKYKDVNLNSPKQVEELLFDKLKLPVLKKSGTGQRSTDQEVLEELSKSHPVPGLIMQYRELYKLKSTYIEALPKSINPKTNRIHTSFSQTMVATGRLSSSNPNLQNIPAAGDLGLKIREAFVAARGKQFISADYSQIELRVLAHMTKEKVLIDAFNNDIDIHKQTAAQIFNVPLEKVTNEERQLGKKINFSIIYGLTPYGLSKDLGIKLSEAKEYITRYFDKYPKIASWIEETVKEATKNGFTTTLLGRRRYVPGLHERNKNLYDAAKRIAVNSPVQGTSAEIMKMAMININEALKKGNFDAKLILQIHDEVVVECPNDEVERVERLLKKEMESVVKWEIPLITNIRTGKNWAKITK